MVFEFEVDSWIGFRSGWVILPAGSAWDLLGIDDETAEIDIPEIEGATVVDRSAGRVRDGAPLPRELEWVTAEEIERRFPSVGRIATRDDRWSERLPTPTEIQSHVGRCALAAEIRRDLALWENATPLTNESMELAKRVARNLPEWRSSEVHIPELAVNERTEAVERARHWEDAGVGFRFRTKRREIPLDYPDAVVAARQREQELAAGLERELNWRDGAGLTGAVAGMVRDLLFKQEDELVAVFEAFTREVDAYDREERASAAELMSELEETGDRAVQEILGGRPHRSVEINNWYSATAYMDRARKDHQICQDLMKMARSHPGTPQTEFAARLSVKSAELGAIAGKLRAAGHLHWMKRRGRVLLWPADAEMPAGSTAWGMEIE
ncbi:hypothetical protein [Pengzhenrongella sicca]|uniref:Uncharacterized protein n=1 Tax=Pengzhenrongella sicca TaxID=2819238 RepID=A0A8A4ZFZ3_9MICO|nr:hypothetical protein [Pengzhenrongella sicca]QTE30321.1 hypothetical protein J4E96_04795 [Pengzhenrongella sicca]